MAKEKLPAIHIYPGDWYKDEISGCSLAAQGLMLRLMFIMHESERYGHIPLDNKLTQGAVHSISRRCGSSPEEFLSHFTELVSANVLASNTEGIYYSRRMVRDAELRLIRSEAGKLGGRPPSKKSKTKAKRKQKTENEDESEGLLFAVVGDGAEGVGFPPALEPARKEILAWLAYKKERREGYKEQGLKAFLTEMSAWNIDDLKKAIPYSMANNWKGIFKRKEDKDAQKTGSAATGTPGKYDGIAQ